MTFANHTLTKEKKLDQAALSTILHSMKTPLSYRKGIPFFYNKTNIDYQKDPYERYDDMVVRQSALHLADQLWNGYPFQAVFDFAKSHCASYHQHTILEIGCGVGRWIGTLAKNYPKATCWGIDYSYQMLKRAGEFWLQGKELQIDMTNKGYPQPLRISGHRLENLQLGLAKAQDLPFEKDSMHLLINSFLLDRLDDPYQSLVEMHRVLAPTGTLILISPLNFNQAKHWKIYYPPSKLLAILEQIGFSILDWQEHLVIDEPLDFHGNKISWNCLGFIAQKVR